MKTKPKKEPKKFNKLYGLPHRLRPETVKLVNKLDKRRKTTFNDKLWDLLNKIEKLNKMNYSQEMVIKKFMEQTGKKSIQINNGEVNLS